MSAVEALLVVPDAAAVATMTAERIAIALTAAVRRRGRADWATTGGSTAPDIYRHLIADPSRTEVPWADVHLWWGDDRFVPRDHPLSNILPVDRILLDPDDGVALPPEHVHPFRTTEAIGAGLDAAWAAAALAGELASADVPARDGWPAFDLVVVGVGGDGHLLSVFPESPAFDSTAWALAIPAPTHIDPQVERMTLNPAVIGAAGEVLVAASGHAKAPVLRDIFGAAADPRRWPAQLARRPGATWILDEAAAALIDR